MPREVDFLGALMPGLLLTGFIAAAVQYGLDWLCGHYGVYRHVWYPALFRAALFACVWGAISLILIH